MKVRNEGTYPIWIKGKYLMPGEEMEVDLKLEEIKRIRHLKIVKSKKKEV